MTQKLSEYKRKRDFAKTSEPAGRRRKRKTGDRFVVHEHHARSMHWDLRLERDGVLVSWAVPKGIPMDPKRNHLAVHVEDHPLEYIDFAGEIPEGEYGAGEVKIWDSGTYECEKWRDDEVIVTFQGERLKGKYVLFQTGKGRQGKNWMIHRMDPPADPGEEPMPQHVIPMMARLSDLPRDDTDYAFEIKWDGVRTIAYVESGRVRLESRTLRDVTSQYPELRKLGREMGSRRAVLDGEIVAFDEEGRPSFQRLQPRMHVVSESTIRRRVSDTPVVYMLFDVLWLEGHSTMSLPYTERRKLLEGLGLNGDNWRTPSYHVGDGKAMLAASDAQGLEGVVAKRLDGRYEPGGRSGAWLKIKNKMSQELVIGGWLPGEGGRRNTLGSLAVGYYEDGKLRYAGNVGTGFTQKTLAELLQELQKRERPDSPFEGRQPPKATRFVEPELVAEVEFRGWTKTRTLRQPSFKGLRDDKNARDVIFEEKTGVSNG
jgi:DNA ligase D-like protein (predicted ligase)/DNA ligase D-like protein (predicted 3'-phosphoesterase)